MSRSNPGSSAATADDALTEVLSTLALSLSVPRAAAFALEGPGDHALRPRATHGLTAEERETLAQTASASPPVDIERLRSERDSFLVPARADAGRERPRTFVDAPHLVIPLVRAERLLGSLHIDTTDPAVAGTPILLSLARLAATVLEEESAARAYAEEIRRSEALIEMFQQMNSSAALPQVLSAICKKTVEAFGVSCAAVFDFRHGIEAATQITNHGIDPDRAERFIRSRHAPGSFPDAGRFFAGQTLVFVASAGQPRALRGWLEGIGMHSVALIPLRAGEATVGAFAIGIRDEQDITPAQIVGLEVVSHHAATAMVLAGLLGQAESAVRFRTATSALAVELNAATDQAQALQLLCARSRRILLARWGAVLLATADRLVEVAADGDPGEIDESLSTALADPTSPAARAFSSGDVVVEAANGEGLTLAIPLSARDGPGGVLLFHGVATAGVMPGMAGEARILGALGGAVLRHLDMVKRLNETNHELRRANTLKDQLLANASHDLRTPLNVIVGYGQLALDGTFGDPPGELRPVLERMVGSACEQLTLVEDLLNLSRMELNILSVRPTNVPLAPLFVEMKFTAASLVQTKSVRAIVRPVDASVWVYADPDRLRQVLGNLLSNAARFTDQGMIQLRAVSDGSRIRIAVQDTGIGIPEESQYRIFEPFAQLYPDRSQNGAGLGLTIARRLAHLMNGTLMVESEVGKGSTFWLTLPAGRPDQDATGRHAGTGGR